MKKIWFAVLALFVFLILAGCQASDTLSFDVEVINLSGNTLLSETIIFDEDDVENVVDLIDEAIGLDYSTSEYGTFIKGIADFYPTEFDVTYNYYFALYVDDEMSTTGIDHVILEDGMKIAFVESTMLDETDVKVDQLIQLFLENYYETYVNDQKFEHYVLAATKQLSLNGYITSSHVSTPSFPVENLVRDTIANTFKATVFEKAFDLNLDTTKTALSGFEASNAYDAVSLLTALRLTSGSSIEIDALINDLATTPSYMDADYAGMILLALSQYRDLASSTQTITDMIDYIQTTLTASGIESWGSANASSTAAVILGLVAQGINPRSEAYTTEGTDLIEALLSYEIDGAYKWQITDLEADLNFSTPQAFSALVAYKIYRDVWGNPAFDLFDF